MILFKKHNQDDDAGGEVSEGPNSFGDAETALGGADSTFGTPDATPSARLGDEEPPAAPAAS